MYELLRAQEAMDGLLEREWPGDWPLETLKVALGLGRKVMQLGTNAQEQDILAVITRTTLVGLLPTPRPVTLVVEKWVS